MALTKITTSLVAVNSLTAANIADNSIDATKIANNQILARHIAAGSLSDQLTGITNSSGDFTIDIVGDIILDADGGDINLKDGGTAYGLIQKDSNDLAIRSVIADGDLKLQVNDSDGGGNINALFIDGSDAGSAIFNADVSVDRYLRLRTTDDQANQWLFYTNTNDSLEFNYNGSGNAEVVVDTSGKVGIGTTSPSSLLHLDGTTNHTYLTVEANSGVGNAIKFVGSNSWILGNDTASGVADNNFALLDGSDARITVDSSGNVGIGTASPQSLLQVAQPNGTMSHFGGIGVTNTHFSGISLGYSEASNANYRKAAIVQEQIGDSAARGHMHLLVDTAADGNSVVLDDAKLSIHGTSGNVGIGDSNPQHPLKVHLTNGEVAMFGSNGMNSPGQYAGIGLGQVLANNTTYQKVKLVAEGRNSGSYIQDFHILVDTVADPNSAVLDDAKLTIDGGTGAVTHPKQPSFNAYAPAVTSGDATIIFGTERHDTGGDYNHTTGIFTAPVAGVYQFHVYVLMDPGNNEYGRVLFRINNTGSSMEQYGDNLTYVAGQPAYFGLGLSLVLYMSANDNIRVHNSGQWPTYGTSYGAFSGHLIG